MENIATKCNYFKHQGRVAAAYIEKLGTFRFDCEYEIEYEYDFLNLVAWFR